MQASNNIVYAYQLPSNRQFFEEPNNTDVVVSKMGKITLENGDQCVAIIFFRESPEKLDELKKNMKINTNQKTIDEYKTLLLSMGNDLAVIEKSLLKIKSAAIKSNRKPLQNLSATSSGKGAGNDVEKKLLRSKSLKNIVNTGEILSQKAKEKANLLFGDIPVPANIFESTIKNKRNTDKVILINENNQPYKYVPKHAPTKIDIFKPRELKNNQAPKNVVSNQVATGTDVHPPTTTTTATTTTTTTATTAHTDTTDDTLATTTQQLSTPADEASIDRKAEKTGEKKSNPKNSAKPLLKRPLGPKHTTKQASDSKAPATPLAPPQKKIEAGKISGRGITLPELPDDE